MQKEWDWEREGVAIKIHEKMCLMRLEICLEAYVDSEGPDQTAPMRSLILPFAVR